MTERSSLAATVLRVIQRTSDRQGNVTMIRLAQAITDELGGPPERDAALARLHARHKPEPYEFKTTQTYCPASDGPTDQCDVCTVLGSGWVV